MIRDATPSDAQAICAIYNHYVENQEPGFEAEPLSVEAMAARIASISALYPWLISVEGGKVLGYAFACAWQESPAYRYTVACQVYLTPAARGQNLGTVLYRELLPRLREAGFHLAVATISLPNAASVRLHEKMGFRKVAHFLEVGCKGKEWVDVGCWQLALARFKPAMDEARRD